MKKASKITLPNILIIFALVLTIVPLTVSDIHEEINYITDYDGNLVNSSEKYIWKRTASSEIFKNPDGTQTIIFGGTFIDDGSRRFPIYKPIQDLINRTINESDITFMGDDYSAHNSEIYNVYYKDQSSSIVNNPVRLKKGDYTVTMTPNSLKFLGQTNKHKKKSFLNVTENYATYEDQFGDGIDLRYTYNYYSLKKEVVINSLQELKDAIKSNPKQDDILQLKFTIKSYEAENESNMNNLKIGSQRVDFKNDLNDVSTDEKIEFLDENNNTVYYLPRPYVEDSNGYRLMLNYTYDVNRFSNLVIKIETPYSWLETAVYPIVIDPTIVLQEADSENLEDIAIYDLQSILNIEDSYTFIKFDISSLNNTLLINDAQLQLYVASIGDGSSGPGVGWDNDTLLYITNNQEWTEEDSVSQIHGMNEINETLFEDVFKALGWDNLNVTDLVQQEVNALNKNISFKLQDPDEDDDTPDTKYTFNENGLVIGSVQKDTFVRFYSKEYSADTTLRPILNITYTPFINIISPTPSQIFTQDAPTTFFNINTTEAMDSCHWSEDAGVTNYSLSNIAGNNWTLLNTSMKDGVHTIIYSCNKTSDGTWVDSDSVTFEVDSINVSVCRDLTVADRTYEVVDNITATGNCISFGEEKNNQTLDMNGFYINGDGTGIGIELGELSSPHIIRDGTINNFSTGISRASFWSNGQIYLIENMSLIENTIGVFAQTGQTWINNSYFNNNGRGLYAGTSSDWTKSYNLIINNSAIYGMRLDSENTVYNSIIENSGTADVNSIDFTDIINTTYSTDIGSGLSRKWYFELQVNDTLGNPLNNIDNYVTFYGILNDYNMNVLGNGTTGILELTEYTLTSSVRSYGTSDNLTVMAKGFDSNSTELNLTKTNNTFIGMILSETSIGQTIQNYIINESNNNKAYITYFNGFENPLPISNTNYIEYNSSFYFNISLDDNIRNVHTPKTSTNEWVNIYYNFSINQSIGDIKKMTLRWKGYDTLSGRESQNIFLWNFTLGNWTRISQIEQSKSSIQNYFYERSDISDFLDNGKIYVGLSGSYGDAPGPSCPFVYSWNGEEWIFDHEAIPFAIMKAGEMTTYERMKNLKSIDGEVKIQVREELPEISWVDYSEIYSVDHPNSNSYISVDWYGNPHTIQNEIAPTCIDKSGKRCDDLVSNFDEKIWTSDLNVNLTLKENNYDWIILEWDKPNDAQNIKVGIRTMKSIIMTWSWGEIMDGVGKNYFPLMEWMLDKIPFLKNQWISKTRDTIRLNVELWNGEEWVPIQGLEAGREKSPELLVVANISNLDTDTVKIRIKTVTGFYEINKVFADFSEDEEMTVKKLSMISAIKDGEDVKEILSYEDEVYTESHLGDVIEITYQDIEPVNGKREYYVAIRGYYNQGEFKEHQSFFGFIKTVFKVLLPLLYEDGFETEYFVKNYIEEHPNYDLNRNITEENGNHHTLYEYFLELDIFFEELDVTLNTPLDDISQTTPTNFNCSATSGSNELSNMTLYLWNPPFLFTETNPLTGFDNSTTFSIIFGNDVIYEWNCLATNNISETKFAVNNFTVNIETNSPAINLQSPTNNQFLNNGTNTFFNFTATDPQGLDTCILYGNWTGSFIQNFTWVNPTNATQNFTQVNLTDGNYIHNVFCNDTIGNEGFASSNFTFTIDTIFPNITLDTITTFTNSQTIFFTSTITDTNLDTCKYSIFNLTGDIDGINENVSFTCGLETQATTTDFGTFNLTIYAIDLAGNENSTNQSFTTTESSGGGGGGGGGGTPKVSKIALKQPTNISVLTKLQRAILFSRIFEACGSDPNKIGSCLLSQNEKLDTLEILMGQTVEITLEEFNIFLSSFNNNFIEEVQVSPSDAQKFDLFVGIPKEGSIFSVTPIFLDKFTFTDEFETIVLSNRELKNCSIVNGGDIGFDCSIEGASAVITFTNILQEIFTFKTVETVISYIDINGDSIFQNVRVRIIKITPQLIFGLILVVLLIIFFFFRKEAKKQLKKIQGRLK